MSSSNQHMKKLRVLSCLGSERILPPYRMASACETRVILVQRAKYTLVIPILSETKQKLTLVPRWPQTSVDTNLSMPFAFIESYSSSDLHLYRLTAT